MDGLGQQLERWQAKHLIDAEQVAAILADAAGRPDGSGAAGGTANGWSRHRLLGEALGYVGAVCAVSAGLLVAGQEWARLGPGARSTLLLIAVAVLVAAGKLGLGRPRAGPCCSAWARLACLCSSSTPS